jgi:flavin reductase (DIM6/NTAB) family NADH-FMN oxidoreductase RutF
MRTSLPVFVNSCYAWVPGPAHGHSEIADLTEVDHLIVVGEVIRVDTRGKDRLLYRGAEFPSQ